MLLYFSFFILLSFSTCEIPDFRQESSKYSLNRLNPAALLKFVKGGNDLRHTMSEPKCYPNQFGITDKTPWPEKFMFLKANLTNFSFNCSLALNALINGLNNSDIWASKSM